MSTDTRLRELERRFNESGSRADEAAYFRERIRAGMNGSGLDDEALNVLCHRLVDAGLTIQDAERLFDSPSMAQAMLVWMRQYREPQPDAQTPENRPSQLGYPEGFRIRSLADQVRIWKQHFPDLDASQVERLGRGPLPEGAEAWGCIPDYEDYHQALEGMLAIIDGQRPFHNYREGRLDPKHLRLIERTQAWYAELKRNQPGDFLVFPFQFGLRHGGYSVEESRGRFMENEFGLGPYEVAALLVTHPDRITGYDQLYGIDCAGCEYDPEGAGAFPACLDMDWGADGLFLYYCRIGSAYLFYGAASSFRSQR